MIKEYAKCSLLSNNFYMLREKYGLSRNDLFFIFGIPISTQEKWEYNISSPPAYMYQLLSISLEYRKNVINKEINDYGC